MGMLAPLVARPMASAIGRPLAALFGMAGKLGRENSMRSPRRTAQTAAALMVGLALVSTMAVFGASLSRSATSSIDQAISAEYIIISSRSAGGGNVQISASAASAAGRVPGVKAVVDRLRRANSSSRTAVSQLTAISANRLGQTVILRMTSGTGAPALSRRAAAGRHHDGQQRSPQGGLGRAGQIRHDRELATCTDRRDLRTATHCIGTTWSGSGTSGPTSPSRCQWPCSCDDDEGRHRTHGATQAGPGAYPGLKIQTRAQFKQAAAGAGEPAAGARLRPPRPGRAIALIGIVNTLMLSVFERTHEIGLLRAVGMRRRQIRAMIRAEAVILSIFGAVIGIVVGTGLGVALAASLKQQGITDVVVPIPNLVVFLIIAALLGLVAASWPARRAAKLDVLAAIAAE